MAAMTRHGTKRLVIKDGNFELELERESDKLPEVSFAPSHARPADIPPSHAPLAPPPEAPQQAEEKGGNFITSPMVGTFYTAPAPEEPAFSKVGDRVEAGQVVCIIEAMKVMNEVKADVSGTIAEILVENGHPVEFGTKLFRVK